MNLCHSWIILDVDLEEAVHVKYPSPDYHFKVGQTRKPLLTTLHSPVSIPVIKLVVVNYQGRAARVWPPATKMCTIHVYARIFQNYKNHARNYRQSKKPGEWVRSSCGNSLPAIVRVLCLENQFLFPNVVWNSIWNWLIENLHPLISRPAVKLVLLLAQVSVCRGKICEIKWKYILAS